jgi:hypothetical protein
MEFLRISLEAKSYFLKHNVVLLDYSNTTPIQPQRYFMQRFLLSRIRFEIIISKARRKEMYFRSYSKKSRNILQESNWTGLCYSQRNSYQGERNKSEIPLKLPISFCPFRPRNKPKLPLWDNKGIFSNFLFCYTIENYRSLMHIQ